VKEKGEILNFIEEIIKISLEFDVVRKREASAKGIILSGEDAITWNLRKLKEFVNNKLP
jgi:hypothetical protein